MDNYDVMRRAAEARFLTYDNALLAKKPGVTDKENCLCTFFLGKPVEISKETGVIFFPEEGRCGNFGETLTILDWLCDRKDYATASHTFCPVSSLPGVFSSGGGGLVMNPAPLAAKIDQNPEKFCRACEKMGGKPVNIGDLGYELQAFPDLPLQLKFYFSDEEFPASMTLLWDQNILQFIRYETVYYLAGCLLKYLM